MRIKVEIDGHLRSKITNADTGEVIQGVTCVRVEHRANDYPRLQLEVIDFDAKITDDVIPTKAFTSGPRSEEPEE